MPVQDHYPLTGGEKLLIGLLLRLTDLIVLVGTAYLAAFVRGDEFVFTPVVSHIIIITVATTFVMLELQGVYRFPATVDANIQTAALLKGLALATVLVMLWVLGTQIGVGISRLWGGMWGAFAGIGIVLVRALHFRIYQYQIAKAETPAHLMVYVQDKVMAKDLFERMCANGTLDQIYGVYCDDPTVSSEHIKIAGSFADMMAAGRAGAADKVIYCGPLSDRRDNVELFRRMQELPADIMVHSGADLSEARVIDFAHFGGMLMARVVERPFGDAGSLLKVWEDRILVVPILLVTLPFMLLVAIAIKLDSRGPVFFRQERLGLNNEVFKVWKFRTMVVHQEVDKVTQATKNDPRITRVGRILRATSIDELPQLFNVIMGEMSLIGPRPLALSHNEQFGKIASGFFIRHRVRPGMTGWAQVNGYRGEITSDQMLIDRLRYDLEYIENWSLFFDIRIFLLTLITGFVNKNAY